MVRACVTLAGVLAPGGSVGVAGLVGPESLPQAAKVTEATAVTIVARTRGVSGIGLQCTRTPGSAYRVRLRLAASALMNAGRAAPGPGRPTRPGSTARPTASQRR